ncbi:hypothetical protein [Kitasatospora sp. NPDC058218]|uniref:hypothetical protein n=1 Tax=Kitasatospora sp. NPDC058218 TaxID=3346385 RepID=UPI0036DE21C3
MSDDVNDRENYLYDGAGMRSASVRIEPTTEIPGLTVIPAEEVNPEDVGTLSLRYVDGVPQLVVSGGTVVPAGLTVVDGTGNAVAVYNAGPVPVAQSRTSSVTIYGIVDTGVTFSTNVNNDDPVPDY